MTRKPTPSVLNQNENTEASPIDAEVTLPPIEEVAAQLAELPVVPQAQPPAPRPKRARKVNETKTGKGTNELGEKPIIAETTGEVIESDEKINLSEPTEEPSLRSHSPIRKAMLASLGALSMVIDKGPKLINHLAERGEQIQKRGGARLPHLNIHLRKPSKAKKEAENAQ